MGAVGGEELGRWEKMEEEPEAARRAAVGKLEKIFVSVRLRPLSEKEIAANDPCDWECINETTVMFRNSLSERSMVPTAYTFDRIFRSDCTTKQVYEEAAKEIALSVVSGINSTIFAYGQTSSGKTYTMTGVTVHTAADIYDYIHKHEERAFVLKFSAIEIYNEAVTDLLSTDSAPLRLLDDPEKGTVIEKLTEENLRDWNHLKALISVCEAQRKIGETSLNETSSRSHQILRLTIESKAREFLGKENSSTLVASVNFVDLAGSERASQALSAGARLKEGCHINRSLLTLGTVIRKLSKGRNGHVPFRDSKLTRILQPSLGGNARTAIICTISPARSHFEQTRNTLLFASCAKEVVNSAQVNVVMSDKALVKHLQKELARLASELRYPGISPSVEALLKEKDAQIKRMENEISNLIQQRDLAHSRLEGLMQDVGKDLSSRQWEESSQTSSPNVLKAYDDVLSVSEPSDIADRSLDCSSIKFAISSNKHYLQTQNQKNPSLRHSDRNHELIGLSGNHYEENDENHCGAFEKKCKEVHCIEMSESYRSEDSNYSVTEVNNSLEHMNSISSEQADANHKQQRQNDVESNSADPVTLEQHLQNVRKNLVSFVKPYPDGSSPWSSMQDPSFRALPFSRSRSCRSILMSSSSFQDDSTPQSISLKEFPGRPEGFQNKPIALEFSTEMRNIIATGSQILKDSTYRSPKLLNLEDDSTVETSRLDNHADVEMAQVHHKELTDDQGNEWDVGDSDAKSTIKDVYLEPTLDTVSPSRWPQEFEKKQVEIIELWHECNVSLVHRTYFYMLFKGDPTDSVYMEVELRRLSFLKSNLSRASLDKTTIVGQRTSSSLKLLRRERDMLCKQMRKSLSAAERESLYIKWGIALDSKQRRSQLARRLWSDTKDLEHIRESASVVARVIGLVEQGLALKEMFGLTFSPQQSNRKTYSWRHGLSYS